jgi:Protein of unknown function (DUF1493)
MRDTHNKMVRLLGCDKQNDLYFGRVSILLDNKEINLKFGIDYNGYLGIKNAIQFRPFDNFVNEPYRHFFVGSYGNNNEGLTMSVRIEQGKTHEQFHIKSSKGLIANLLWFSKIENINQVQHLLDIADDRLLEKIKAFTSEKLGVDISKLSRGTRLEEDNGIIGLDTFTFLDDFIRTFNINLPTDFDINRYVTSENFELPTWIRRLFSRKTYLPKIELTLGDLEKIAFVETWLDEQNNSHQHGFVASGG